MVRLRRFGCRQGGASAKGSACGGLAAARGVRLGEGFRLRRGFAWFACGGRSAGFRRAAGESLRRKGMCNCVVIAWLSGVGVRHIAA